MKQHKDRAIILARVDYGEKDRILTLLCQEQGKVSVLAKSVRAQKSRLAGGIELLSESEVSFIDGRTNVSPLTSARLRVHFDRLAGDIHKMQQAFGFIKTVNEITEEGTGQEYYQALLNGLTALNDDVYDPRLVETWFNLQMLHLSGSAPNLQIQNETSEHFEFDYDNQKFIPSEQGTYKKNDLKLLRLSVSQSKPPKIQDELGSEDRLLGLTRTLLKINLTEV